MEQLVIKWLHSFHFHLFTFTFSRLGKITNWLGTAQSLEEWTPLWSTPGICGFQIFCSITGALRKWLIDTWCSSHIHIRIETNKGNVCWPYSQSKWWLKNYCLLLRKTWLLNLITSFVFHLRFRFVYNLLQTYSRKFVFSFNNENLKKHSWQKPSMVHNKTITVKK